MTYRRASYLVCAIALCLAFGLVAQQKKTPGYTDTAILPGQNWHVHDSNRPHPNMVTPGKVLGAPPSDAIARKPGKVLTRLPNPTSDAVLKMASNAPVVAAVSEAESRPRIRRG